MSSSGMCLSCPVLMCMLGGESARLAEVFGRVSAIGHRGQHSELHGQPAPTGKEHVK